MAGAPFGNSNAAKGRRWNDAINRALERRSKAAGIEELDRLADEFLTAVEAMTEATDKRGPSIAGFSELADRLDGRPAQSHTIAGDPDNPLVTRIERVVTKSEEGAT